MLSGLSESLKGIWSGDVDLNDGKLQDQYKRYSDRLSFIKKIGLDDWETKVALVKNMDVCTKEILDDITFVAKGTYIHSTYLHVHLKVASNL